MSLLACEIGLGVLLFFFGTCVFSFLNVVIYRVPKKLSFVKGFSICPTCNHRLGTLDLVPLWSYVFLRGKCRYCGASIGSRDTWIELLGGCLALLCCKVYVIGFGTPVLDVVYNRRSFAQALLVFAFFGILTVVSFMDIDTMEIADGCWMAIVALAVVSYFTFPEVTIAQRLIGMLCVSVPMFLTNLVVTDAFGGGDIKLLAACGLYLGWKVVLVSTFLGFVFGGSYGIYLLATKKKGRKEHFAFGPFLCLGMAIGVLAGGQIIDWYLGFMV